MKFQQELQHMLQVQSLPPLSHGSLAYLESCLIASLTELFVQLRYTLRRYAKSSATAGINPSTIPFGSLLLLLHLHNQPRFYRLSSFLSLEEARKKAKEGASGASEIDMLNETDDPNNDTDQFDVAWLGGGGGGNAVASTSVAGAAVAGAGAAAGIILDPSSSGSVSASTAIDPSSVTLPQSFIALGVLATFADEHASALLSRSSRSGGGATGQGEEKEVEEDAQALTKRKLPPGFIEHLRRLQAADAITRNMSGSEYVQYSEARAQAGFTHHKVRSKRFRDFITPHLLAHDIPISDELIDILGFLAHEIVFDHIEQGKHAARRRITTMRRIEMRAKKATLRAAVAASTAKAKSKANTMNRKKANVNPENSLAKVGKQSDDDKTQKSSKPPMNLKKKKKTNKMKMKKKMSDAQATQEEELRKLAELRKEEQNRHPDGPFTAPAGSTFTHGMPVSLQHCSTDFDDNELDERGIEMEMEMGMPNDAPAVEHSKVDNTSTHASITSAYDVLLGDFEQGFYSSKRNGWDRVPPLSRKRRFVTLFR